MGPIKDFDSIEEGEAFYQAFLERKLLLSKCLIYRGDPEKIVVSQEMWIRLKKYLFDRFAWMPFSGDKMMFRTMPIEPGILPDGVHIFFCFHPKQRIRRSFDPVFEGKARDYRAIWSERAMVNGVE